VICQEEHKLPRLGCSSHNCKDWQNWCIYWIATSNITALSECPISKIFKCAENPNQWSIKSITSQL